jgi:hypothetical protein
MNHPKDKQTKVRGIPARMKKLERGHQELERKIDNYVTSMSDDFSGLQEKYKTEHSELVAMKVRLGAVERRLDLIDRKSK